MEQKKVKKDYEAIFYIIILVAVISCAFAFIYYRTEYAEKYLIDYEYVFFDEGIANIVNLKTGYTSEIPIEEYCKNEQRSVIWIQTTDQKYGDKQRTVKEVCLTNELGKTQVVFDTEYLWENVGRTFIYDIICTENGRIIFTAGDIKSDTYLFEYTNQKLVKLYDGEVYFHFSVNAKELIFRTIPDNYDEPGELRVLNLIENTPSEHKAYGDYIVYLNDDERLYFNRSNRLSVKQSVNSANVTHMDYDPDSLEKGCIVPNRPPLVSEDGDIAIIYYVNSFGDPA